ncbi:RNA polymerase sigma factor [Desulfosporosinus metallidurans]|uniref:BNR repeat domain protein n=1 Tax=Desulfosporosinus metallidurans TaxID=1888891 RepID=A0A1Q8QE10_9FIRM|nr:hypothetical protein [Desulfosporosinus metallidurans]OLN25568.1 BNR repeat domain protein [Desulfosporosinus metallidurans]
MDDGSTKGKIIKIVTRLKSGDKQAFEELYELTHNKVYFLALKMVRNHENALGPATAAKILSTVNAGMHIVVASMAQTAS